MKTKKILGVVLVIIGVAMLLGSNYIKTQVLEGNQRIASAEKSVKQADTLFSLNPVSKEVGKGFTGSANKRIAEGKDEIAYYTSLAQGLQTGGIAVIVVGAVVFIWGFRKKKGRS